MSVFRLYCINETVYQIFTTYDTHVNLEVPDMCPNCPRNLGCHYPLPEEEYAHWGRHSGACPQADGMPG